MQLLKAFNVCSEPFLWFEACFILGSDHSQLGHSTFSHHLTSFSAGVGSQDVRSITRGRTAALRLALESIPRLTAFEFE